MSKKEDLLQRFQQQGYERVNLRWVPKNPYGKKHKVSGWIYKLSGDSEWSKLGNNYEDAYKEIDLI
jgi:hypothetical protein